QGHLVPHGWQRGPQMWVVGQQRLTRLGVFPWYNPRVGTDPFTGCGHHVIHSGNGLHERIGAGVVSIGPEQLIFSWSSMRRYRGGIWRLVLVASGCWNIGVMNAGAVWVFSKNHRMLIKAIAWV